MYNLKFSWRLDESGQRVLVINGEDQPWVVSWNKSADKVLGEHAVVLQDGIHRCIAFSLVDAQDIAEKMCRRAIARTIVRGGAA